MASPDFPDHPFWDFSLEVYGRDGVPGACLELQDAHELDVNVLLFCCWIGRSGRGRLTAAETDAMIAAVGEWHEIAVRGVRAVRQRLKGGLGPAPVELSEPLRKRLATIEVQLEHIEQLILAETVDRPAEEATPVDDRVGDAVANAAAYFEAFGARPGRADADSFATILAAVFPDRSAADIARAAAALAAK